MGDVVEGPAASASAAPRKEKKPSVLGVALGARIGPLAGGELSPPSSPMSINMDVTARISKKYAARVKESEELRAKQHLPLDRRATVRPDARCMTTDVKRDMDSTQAEGDLLSQSANPAWEKKFKEEDFQKRMEYLNTYTKNGNFIEHYGTQGQYEGEFMYGMRHGKGEHLFREETYDGDWKWDKRDGLGTLSMKDGTTLKAEWHEGKPSGFATMTDANGTIVYEGEFKNGKRHGLGRQLYESGDMYDGGWADGKLHDRGVYSFANGDKLYGMWNKGQYDGVGVFHYADGSISRRVYKNGILQSVQDYESTSQRFGKTVNRSSMHMHSQDGDFPKDVFLLSTA